jgi:hypothetical protein
MKAIKYQGILWLKSGKCRTIEHPVFDVDEVVVQNKQQAEQIKMALRVLEDEKSSITLSRNNLAYKMAEVLRGEQIEHWHSEYQAELQHCPECHGSVGSCDCEFNKCKAQAAEIERVRPLADCYESACRTLGIEKDILGYVERLKEDNRQYQLDYEQMHGVGIDLRTEIKRLKEVVTLEKQKCKEIVEHTCSIHDETGWVCSVYRERNRYETAIKKAIGTLDSADIGTKKILKQALKAATPQKGE